MIVTIKQFNQIENALDLKHALIHLKTESNSETPDPAFIEELSEHIAHLEMEIEE